MSWRTIFFISAILALVLLYSVRSVLSPFVLAALAAYILNPVATFLQKKVFRNRVAAIAAIYILLVGLIAALIFWVGGSLFQEAKELTVEGNGFSAFSQNSIDQLPEVTIGDMRLGLKPIAQELPRTLVNTVNRWQTNLGPVVTSAFGRIVNFLVFFVATFYFLKDGNKLLNFLRALPPDRYRSRAIEFEKEINQVLGNYLRGQVLLVLIMSTASWLLLTILGVKFALTLALFTGVFELVPFVGPIVATTVVALTSFLTMQNNWGLDPVTLATLVTLLYIILRLTEDYFVIPQILGHVTKLHPLLVLIAVLVGGHLIGAVGFVLAVPLVAALRIMFIFINRETHWKS